MHIQFGHLYYVSPMSHHWLSSNKSCHAQIVSNLLNLDRHPRELSCWMQIESVDVLVISLNTLNRIMARRRPCWRIYLNNGGQNCQMMSCSFHVTSTFPMNNLHIAMLSQWHWNPNWLCDQGASNKVHNSIIMHMLSESDSKPYTNFAICDGKNHVNIWKYTLIYKAKKFMLTIFFSRKLYILLTTLQVVCK